MRRKLKTRRGLTLTELLIASTIMVMIVGAMSMLAMTVHSANDHCQGQVARRPARPGRARPRGPLGQLGHCQRTLSGLPGDFRAARFLEFPGYARRLAARSAPPPTPAGSRESTRSSCSRPIRQQPNCLLEIRLPGNTTTVPAASDVTAWRTARGGPADQPVGGANYADRPAADRQRSSSKPARSKPPICGAACDSTG